jgi:DNA-directed RNA polymerase subunit RPC12/RpoP
MKTKTYPQSYTMGFGETLSLSVTFELTKECPKCQGKGDFGWNTPDGKQPAGSGYEEIECPHCSNNGLPKGKVQRYWTPDEAAKEIKAKTGIDWEWPIGTHCWYYSDVSGWFLGWYSGPMPFPQCLSFSGQCKPPQNWRPEGINQ